MQNIAMTLLNLGAVQFRPENPYTWSSGIKSPIYCDNRLLMSDVDGRKQTTAALEGAIKELGHIDVIAGTATAGIPHAAWVADRMELPMIYVRSSSKKHGKQNLIEGQLHRGQKVVIVEDLLSTGGSAIAAAKAVEEAGGEVVAIVAIVTYDLPILAERKKNLPYQVLALTHFDTIVQKAVERADLTEKQAKEVLAWKASLQMEANREEIFSS
ncbi:orotate phosphoribosyltransferase [Paenalkalicoccus suaedae]